MNSFDDVYVSSPNIDYPVSSENSLPIRDRRPPEGYGIFEADIGLLAYALHLCFYACWSDSGEF
jgi:hypothetical protein